VVQLEEERHPLGIGPCRGRFKTCPYVGGINGLVQRLVSGDGDFTKRAETIL
jgi:hypothetical protein